MMDVTLRRNLLINLTGLALPTLVSLVTVPLYIKVLGVDRFGVMTLVWVLVGYSHAVRLRHQPGGREAHRPRAGHRRPRRHRPDLLERALDQPGDRADWRGDPLGVAGAYFHWATHAPGGAAERGDAGAAVDCAVDPGRQRGAGLRRGDQRGGALLGVQHQPDHRHGDVPGAARDGGVRVRADPAGGAVHGGHRPGRERADAGRGGGARAGDRHRAAGPARLRARPVPLRPLAAADRGGQHDRRVAGPRGGGRAAAAALRHVLRGAAEPGLAAELPSGALSRTLFPAAWPPRGARRRWRSPITRSASSRRCSRR